MRLISTRITDAPCRTRKVVPAWVALLPACVALAMVTGVFCPNKATAQIVSAEADWVTYKIVPRVVYEQKPVTYSRWIDETSTEKQTVTTYKPVWNTEQRTRTRSYLKPVKKTSLREEKTYRRKPVTETKYRERVVEETVYETRTEMRDETYTVQKPVTETSAREEDVTVQQKISEDMVEVQDIVTWNVTATGELVPEYSQRRRPVKVTRYVDRVETRKVPQQITRYVEETRTRKVPVTHTVPVTTVKKEQIPYTETRYVYEEIVRKIPVEETTYQTVEVEEPYQVEVCRWSAVTREVEIPKVVRRRVDYQVTESCPRTVWMKVPIDHCGNELGQPTPLDSSQVQLENPSLPTDVSQDWSTGYGSTQTDSSGVFSSPLEQTDAKDAEKPQTSQRATLEESSNDLRYRGQWNETDSTGEGMESENGVRSILVPETGISRTERLKPIPPDGETGNEEAGEGEEPGTREASDVSPGDASTPTLEGSVGASTSVQGRSAIDNLSVGQPTPKPSMPDDVPTETGNEFAADRNPQSEPKQESGSQLELSSPD